MDDRKTGAPEAPKDRAQVSALYPVNDHPIWQSSSLRVAKDLLMSRKWYATQSITGEASFDSFDYGPGTLEVGATHDSSTSAKVLGEFWVSYSVTLDGSRLE
jgi:hypothetical protein